MADRSISADFLKHIEIGSRALLMYSEKHPSTNQAVENAYAQMNEALRDRQEVTVKIEDEQLVVEASPLEKGNPVMDRLMHEMVARNIFNLTFMKGITREELVFLMQNLNLKPQRIMELGGFDQILKNAGIQHVIVNRIIDLYDEYYIPAPVQLVEETHEIPAPESKKLCEELLKREKLGVEDLVLVGDALDEGLSEQKSAEIDALTKKVFQCLTANTSEERLAAVNILPRIVSMLGPTERWKNIEFSVVFVVSRCYRKESNSEVLAALQSFLLNAFEKNFIVRNFGVCEELLSTIRSQVNKSEAATKMMSAHIAKIKDRLLEEIARKSEGAESALKCIQLCDAAGVSLLFDRLAEEEDRSVRSNLINYMEQLNSEQVLAEIEARLSDSRWYVARNMITILGKMRMTECPVFLRKAAQNPEPRVAKEIVKILYKSAWKPDSQLILQLLQHPDKSVRLQGVHLAHRLEIQAAAPHVIAVARAAGESDLRTACLQTLLHWKVQDAIPLAETILQKPTVGKVDLPERNTAVMILGELKRQDARVLLEKIAVSDPNPETRSIARSYL